MIKFTGDSSKIQIIEGDHSCLCILKEFVGEITSITDECKYLTFVLFGDCIINSNISLTSTDKLDTIIVKGEGSLCVTSLNATTIEVYADVKFDSVTGNVVKFCGCQISKYCEAHSETYIKAAGHIWVTDTILTANNCNIGISSPYVLIDNSTCNIQASIKAIQTSNDMIIEHCDSVNDKDCLFTSSASVLGSDNITPKKFLYALLRDESGNVVQVATRRKLYGYNVETLSEVWDNAKVSGEQIIPAQLADAFDEFKHSTQYTNVDLHRWISDVGETLKGRGSNYIPDETIALICQDFWSGESVDWEAIPVEIVNRICEVLLPEYVYDGHPHTSTPIDPQVVRDILYGDYVWPKRNGYELDEVSGRAYEVGMYSLYSYRNTDLKFYEPDNTLSEDRELP